MARTFRPEASWSAPSGSPLPQSPLDTLVCPRLPPPAMAGARLSAANGLYGLEDTEEATQKLHKQYQRILAPLSLFPATYSRRLPDPGSKENTSASSPSAQKPLSLAALTHLLKARMELGPEWETVCPRAQNAFQEIILAEVKRIWKDVQHSYDPAFSPQVNREIHQDLVAYIGVVCQHLFLLYMSLMKHCQALRVYTDCANLTRFSAQLSRDCSTFLKVSAVRHCLVMEMKIPHKTPHNLHKDSGRKSLVRPAAFHPLGCRLGYSISYFIKLIRPPVPTLRQKLAKDMKELEELPPLDLSKIKHLLPLPRPSVPMRQVVCAAVTTPCPLTPGPGTKTKQERPHQAVTTLRRSQSLPNMRVGKLLADELGIRLTFRRLTPDLPSHYAECTEEDELKISKNLAEDLRRLVQGSILKSSQAELDEDSELHPLIKVLTWRKSNEVHCAQLQQKLCSLQQEQECEKQQRDTIISAPASHPQAATVNLTVHNRMVVKAADLQVSERTYLDTVAIDKYPAVYNHLLGEIDISTCNILDSNLSAGEEVKKIYMELMNTIPKDHQKVDIGPLIEPCANKIELSTCYASSTLTRRKSEQVINNKLSKILPAGPFILEEVTDTLATPNLPFNKRFSKKQRATWFTWWKATFNTDDYLTYISTKDSDYLQVIFHLYNSEEKPNILHDNERKLFEMEIEKRKQAAELQIQKEERKQAEELQSQKEEYLTEQLNSNAISMWGLGRCFDYDHHNTEDLKVFQRRLERLWTVLHFSEQERLNMAIKYSSKGYYPLLPHMLQSWEVAAQWIQDRELLLSELESFEQTASDPNRFFKKATRSPKLRMKESIIRSNLYSKLSQYGSELFIILNHIKETFKDTVTFKGRPYVEKMEWDLVEMLYWLQQERRTSSLNKVIQRRAPWKLPPVT